MINKNENITRKQEQSAKVGSNKKKKNTVEVHCCDPAFKQKLLCFFQTHQRGIRFLQSHCFTCFVAYQGTAGKSNVHVQSILIDQQNVIIKFGA